MDGRNLIIEMRSLGKLGPTLRIRGVESGVFIRMSVRRQKVFMKMAKGLAVNSGSM